MTKCRLCRDLRVLSWHHADVVAYLCKNRHHNSECLYFDVAFKLNTKCEKEHKVSYISHPRFERFTNILGTTVQDKRDMIAWLDENVPSEEKLI